MAASLGAEGRGLGAASELGEEADATPEAVVALAGKIERRVIERLGGIKQISKETGMLAINSAIEAARAGSGGAGFKVLASEIKALASQAEGIAVAVESEVAASLAALKVLGERMSTQVRGDRLVDLSLNAIEIIDRNLFERTCDVRWWATDSAVVAAAENPASASAATARLAVILSAYTVYLDLWICDAKGRVIASARPDQYPRAVGTDVAQRSWFVEAMASVTGDDYAVADVVKEPALNGGTVLTYSAAIRSGGAARGEVIGVLGIHFDWAPQARAVVEGVRLSAEERGRSRVLLVDSRRRVIAASAGAGDTPETVPERAVSGESGTWTDEQGSLWAHHRTPGYETYRGLGWSGVIVQRQD